MNRMPHLVACCWIACLVSSLAGCAAERSAERGLRPDEARPIRVACAGDSMTRRPVGDAYPEQLDALLGAGWDVRNFGHDGTGALRETGRPYWGVAEFQAVADFEPDVVILMLGTNDAARSAEHRTAFERDYAALVDHMRSLPSRPRVIVATPPPLMPGRDESRLTNLRDDQCPAVHRVAAARGLTVIELQTLAELQDPSLYPDKVHLNAEGAGIAARHIQPHLLALTAR